MNCTTHHICDCLQEKLERLEKVRDAAENLARALIPAVRRPGISYPGDELIKALAAAKEAHD